MNLALLIIVLLLLFGGFGGGWPGIGIGAILLVIPLFVLLRGY